MRQFTVIFEEPAEGWSPWQGFTCWADDAEHAEEQCMNANPEARVLWVNEGLGFDVEGP